MSHIGKIILKKLIKIGLDVEEEYDSDKHYFISDEMIICLVDKQLTISFHVSLLLELVANTVLLLNQIELVNNIKVLPCFIVDEDKKTLIGKKAYEYFKQMEIKKEMDDFIKNFNYVNMLIHEKPQGSC